ncbi:hypothetical protein FHS18_000876 [Paenibacillus phyllosphaerae]|uniref:DUF4179 domain-containing protein n=1 Tax=Paenibacillus phyllosphaerae TaxID=274593 RepID=A0A7W5FLA9_9BACL|nr:DUF4179 domain-containing protein [Paenibacillus phyllosphaerae]MBB3108824.1 hypothetical protein [Paenibacillus phyllosphaerae]
MAASEIEKELKKVDKTTMEMSPLVRARLDETYAQIAQQPKRTRRTKPSRLRRITTTAAAAGLLGIGVFASAFVSPAMADSLKNIPVIGSIFSTIQGDIGLRTAGTLGLTSDVDRHVSYEDVKLEVSETVYDGTRAAFLLTVDAPNLENGRYTSGKKTMKLSDAIEQLTITADGKTQDDAGSIASGGVFYGSAGETHPNTLVIEQVMAAGSNSEAPETFDATVKVTLNGIDHEFAVDIPFRKTTSEAIRLAPNLAAANDDYTFSLDEVSVTPVTTRLATTIALNDADALTTKEERRLIRVGIAVFDDQGRRLPALNGDGIIQDNKLTYDRRFATTPGHSKYLLVKPFVIQDDFAEEVKEDQYLPELELKVDLPAAD